MSGPQGTMTPFRVLTAAMAIVPLCTAYLDTWTRQPDQNHLNATLGAAMWCDGGSCKDGTDMGQAGGQCCCWNDFCKDLGMANRIPTCKANQVLLTWTSSFVDSAGQCTASFGGRNWQSNSHKWECADCKKGYVPVTRNRCAVPTPKLAEWCVGCTEPDEQLVYDSTTDSGRACAPKCASALQVHAKVGDEWRCMPLCGSLDTAAYNTDKRCGKAGSCADTLCDVPLTTKCATGGSCKINSAGLKVLKDDEKACPTIYTLRGHQTLGWGHDCTSNKETNCAAKYSPPITLAEAYNILSKDLTSIGAQLKSKFGQGDLAALNTNQYSALLLFAYNSGAGTAHSAFGDQIKKRDYAGFCTALYNSKYGTPERGHAQGTLCRTATNVASGC